MISQSDSAPCTISAEGRPIHCAGRRSRRTIEARCGPARAHCENARTCTGSVPYGEPVRNDRRVRRLVVDKAVWYWSVRQRVRPAYADCRVTLSFFTNGSKRGAGRRLSLVFAPNPHGVVSHSYFESGTVVRLPDRSCLNLYEPGTVRRLLHAAMPVLELRPSDQDIEVDGWPCFAEVVDCSDARGSAD